MRHGKIPRGPLQTKPFYPNVCINASTTIVTGGRHQQHALFDRLPDDFVEVGFGLRRDRLLPRADVDNGTSCSSTKLLARAKSNCETGRDWPAAPFRRNNGRMRPEQSGAKPRMVSPRPKIRLQMPVPWGSAPRESGGTIVSRTSIDAPCKAGWLRSGSPSTTLMAIPLRPRLEPLGRCPKSRD